MPPIPQYKPPRTRKPTRESEPGPPISLPKQNQASKNTSFGRGLADRNQHLNQVQCNLQVCFRWNRLLMLMCARLNYTLDSAHELSAAICSYANSWPWLATRPALCYEAAVGACARETHHRLQKSFEKGGEPPATASGSCRGQNEPSSQADERAVARTRMIGLLSANPGRALCIIGYASFCLRHYTRVCNTSRRLCKMELH